MNKKNILIWLVVLLAILNITTIATIVIHNYTEKPQEQTLALDNDGQNMLTGRCMRQIVGFDKIQMEQFRNAKHEFQPTANQIIIDIDSLKNEMFIELNKTEADTLTLNNISDEIGRLHADLKKKTFVFYISIKSISKPEQLEKLKKVFTPLFNNISEDCKDGNSIQSCNKNGFRNQQ
ncbi:MAG: hypothetical protein GZ091_01410 [Paludibacter sp.]|nr:hypothetical protein [Paludibacter sp.]